MAKSKYAPALFEVIRTRPDAKDGGKLSVPKWWKRGSQQPTPEVGPEQPAETLGVGQADESSIAPAEPPGGEEEPATTPASLVAGQVEPVISATVPESPAWPARASGTVEEVHEVPPVLQVNGSRVALSLKPMTAVVAGGALLLVLFTSYELGHHSGFKSAKAAPAAAPGTDEVDQLMNGPVKREVLKPPTPQARMRSNRERENTPARVTPPPAEMNAGKNVIPAAAPSAKAGTPQRVHLETFKSTDKESAEFAQKWLATKKSIKASLETHGDKFVLVSEDSFDLSKPGEDERARKYKETIKSLGKTLGHDMVRAGLKSYVFSSPALRNEK